jgi:hypothetical protein
MTNDDNWRLAYSLEKLRNQANALAPKRSKASDGTIGDGAHKETKSDHNARCLDGKNPLVVTALDITHDPKNGLNSYDVAEALRLSKDPRIKYIISCGKIAHASKGFKWQKYNGKNSHCHHVHISVKCGRPIMDNTADFTLTGATATHAVAPTNPKKPAVPRLKLGSSGPEVKRVQALLGLEPTGVFDTFLQANVIARQQTCKLKPDGIVGGDTWACLEKLK